MKYDILKKIKPSEEKKPEVVRSGDLWICEKCKMLYGEGEIILKKISNNEHYCANHPKARVYVGDIDYFKKNYELKEHDKVNAF